MTNKKDGTIKLNYEILEILLKDRTTNKNIIWATDIYKERGIGYHFTDSIRVETVSGYNGNIIRPRIDKGSIEKEKRIKEKAEVFTPAWVCNAQNNLIDEKWFGYSNVFNRAKGEAWVTRRKKIDFNNRKWENYITDKRLEISCGEAPYLVSRYDVITGKSIKVQDRIGILDRKLRIINENVKDESEWKKWAENAYKSVYGYEWQGDNLIIARKNLIETYIENYNYKFKKDPEEADLKKIAEIISWNVWQMDGVKCVIPNSCKTKAEITKTLFGDVIEEAKECAGCKNGNVKKHNGIYCVIKDWTTNKKIKFVNC